ncbi:MAG TPA: PQQ-dependent sugar dehydrogenase [Candidatus Limnocylindrales bacterium]|nr:PQQ-dependent sugar dehydrogenase [Candidatus Limnocylindrales bacterium]
MTDSELSASIGVTGLDQPTGIAFLAEDDYLVIEKGTGNVRRVQGGALEAEPVLDLAVNNFDERGLLGIELHPDFASNSFVYLYWTARDDSAVPDSLLGEDSSEPTEVPDLGNRVDRFTWDGSVLTWESEIVKMRSNTLPADTSGRVRGNHDAGPLEFGPDGMLYVQNGDQNLRGQLQNIVDGPAPDDLNFTGVILRLNDDGTVPDDNPFVAAGTELGGEAGENVQAIWAYGIRNSFGLRFHPDTGDLWQTENGDDSWDEINRFTAAANSGWIQVMGPPERFDEYRQLEVDSPDGLDNPDFPPDLLAETVEDAQAAMFQLEGSQYVAPVFAWRYPPAATALEFVLGDELGASSANSIFVGTVLTDSLIRYPLADDGSGLALEGGLADNVDDNAAKGDIGESADYVVGTGFGVITDIVLGPDGRLYVSSVSNGSIYIVSAAGDVPPASASPSAGATPTGSPAGSPSASPAETGSPSASPGESPSAAEVLIQTDAGTENLFVPDQASVPSGAQVALTFENISTVPHNLTFGPPINQATSVAQQPGTSETINFSAPEPGDYQFVCTLHPGMEGTLTVTP